MSSHPHPIGVANHPFLLDALLGLTSVEEHSQNYNYPTSPVLRPAHDFAASSSATQHAVDVHIRTPEPISAQLSHLGFVIQHPQTFLYEHDPPGSETCSPDWGDIGNDVTPHKDAELKLTSAHSAAGLAVELNQSVDLAVITAETADSTFQSRAITNVFNPKIFKKSKTSAGPKRKAPVNKRAHTRDHEFENESRIPVCQVVARYMKMLECLQPGTKISEADAKLFQKLKQIHSAILMASSNLGPGMRKIMRRRDLIDVVSSQQLRVCPTRRRSSINAPPPCDCSRHVILCRTLKALQFDRFESHLQSKLAQTLSSHEEDLRPAVKETVVTFDQHITICDPAETNIDIDSDSLTCSPIATIQTPANADTTLQMSNTQSQHVQQLEVVHDSYDGLESITTAQRKRKTTVDVPATSSLEDPAFPSKRSGLDEPEAELEVAHASCSVDSSDPFAFNSNGNDVDTNGNANVDHALATSQPNMHKRRLSSHDRFLFEKSSKSQNRGIDQLQPIGPALSALSKDVQLASAVLPGHSLTIMETISGSADDELACSIDPLDETSSQLQLRRQRQKFRRQQLQSVSNTDAALTEALGDSALVDFEHVVAIGAENLETTLGLPSCLPITEARASISVCEKPASSSACDRISPAHSHTFPKLTTAFLQSCVITPTPNASFDCTFALFASMWRD